jgi:hypothetical protein
MPWLPACRSWSSSRYRIIIESACLSQNFRVILATPRPAPRLAPRRLVVGCIAIGICRPSPSRAAVADCQSATQQVANLRYAWANATISPATYKRGVAGNLNASPGTCISWFSPRFRTLRRMRRFRHQFRRANEHASKLSSQRIVSPRRREDGEDQARGDPRLHGRDHGIRGAALTSCKVWRPATVSFRCRYGCDGWIDQTRNRCLGSN